MASRVGTHIKRRRSRRDWTKIPYDITASILSRLDGDTESLAAAEMVCKTWREICKDPKLWRTIIDFHSNHTIYMLGPPRRFDIVKMCRHAIHRSSGSFINVNVDYFCNVELLKYITNRPDVERTSALRLKVRTSSVLHRLTPATASLLPGLQHRLPGRFLSFQD
ncbi:hypothetical protein ACLB2K_076751 [Fragaria x ananassa]